MTSTWTASAPSNIALIKYMGRLDAFHRIPANPSLSYTTEAFRSKVVLELAEHDDWHPWEEEGYEPLEVQHHDERKHRVLSYLKRLKALLPQSSPCFTIRSANTFPEGAGLASSASSFAALIRALALAWKSLGIIDLSVDEQSAWARLGSGSACRSLMGPWVVWEGERVYPLETAFPRLIHHVLVLDVSRKKISSAEAHRRVETSLLFQDRPIRARARLEALKHALAQGDWGTVRLLAWHDFWDMHALFATSSPPFSYWTAEAIAVLAQYASNWENGDGPIVTVDAGPNLHLLYREDQRLLAEEEKASFVDRGFKVMS